MRTEHGRSSEDLTQRTDERARLEPRWLYVSVGALVFAVIVLGGLILFAVALFLHEANDVMAGF